MGLDYVDIFYSHRFDPETPLEETIGALDTAVRSGRALYAGISSYSPETRRGTRSCATSGRPCSSISRRIRSSTAGSSLTSWTRSASSASGAWAFRRSRRGCSPTGTSTASLPTHACGEFVVVARPPHRRGTREDPRAERDCARPRQSLAAARTCLDTARRAHDLDPDRRVGRRRSSSSFAHSSLHTTATLAEIDRYATDAAHLWARSSGEWIRAASAAPAAAHLAAAAARLQRQATRSSTGRARTATP